MIMIKFKLAALLPAEGPASRLRPLSFAGLNLAGPFGGRKVGKLAQTESRPPRAGGRKACGRCETKTGPSFETRPVAHTSTQAHKHTHAHTHWLAASNRKPAGPKARPSANGAARSLPICIRFGQSFHHLVGILVSFNGPNLGRPTGGGSGSGSGAERSRMLGLALI